MDHFIGFDQVVRTCLGRPVQLQLFGPPGIIDQVGHRLAAYTWNLIQNYPENFGVRVTEVHPDGRALAAEFGSRSGFARRNVGARTISGGVLVDEEEFRVRGVLLDHKVPCLAFSLEETAHVNVWKTKLREMGFPTGPWLKEFKRAVLRGDADETLFRVWWRAKETIHEQMVPLGVLKERALQIVPGQKIAYVVDVVYHEDNARAIVNLARDADTLFIEATFLHQDVERAADRSHLTARQAGLLARDAGVKVLAPFHFSPRYAGQGELLRGEAEHAFSSPSGSRLEV
jgi:ribonuclease Z